MDFSKLLFFENGRQKAPAATRFCSMFEKSEQKNACGNAYPDYLIIIIINIYSLGKMKNGDGLKRSAAGSHDFF